MKTIFLIFFTIVSLSAKIASFTSLANGSTRSIKDTNTTAIQVTINTALLQKDALISIDLPAILTVTFKNEKLFFRHNNNFSWSGKPINGLENDYTFITTKSGRTYGVIVYNGIKYVLRHIKNDTYSIAKVQKKEHSCGNDFLKLAPHPTHRSTASPNILRSTPLRSTQNTVNVMILYTQAFSSYFGSSLNAIIQSSIDYANNTMTNSGIALTFNLTKQQLYETSETNESADIDDALARIAGKYVSGDYYYSDISINEDIRRLRADYAADMISLFRLNNTGGTVGVGFIPDENSRTGLRDSSYNVSEGSFYIPIESTYTHESGHNFGCGHSRYAKPNECNNALFNYACGYGIYNQFGTIMSYEDNTIPYFSNPDIIHNVYGVTGTSTEDCSQSIEQTKGYMAMNNSISEPNESGDVLDNGTINGFLFDVNDRDGFEIGLGGSTTFAVPYGFYINLYDNKGFFFESFNIDKTLTLDNDIYYIIISRYKDYASSFSYVNSSGSYSVNITSNYVQPPVNNTTIVPIINYLLF